MSGAAQEEARVSTFIWDTEGGVQLPYVMQLSHFLSNQWNTGVNSFVVHDVSPIHNLWLLIFWLLIHQSENTDVYIYIYIMKNNIKLKTKLNIKLTANKH